MLSLQNKKILIMGAGGNIGTVLSIFLSKLGVKCVLAGRNETRLQEVLSLLDGKGHEIRIVDVGQIGTIAVFMESCAVDGSKLNGLVYASGIWFYYPLRVLPIEKLEEVMRVNYFGFVESVKQFSKKQISANGSSIVAFSSYAALNPGKSQLAYGASKAAVDNSVIVMAKELEKRKIRINSIRPGAVQWRGRTFEENIASNGSVVDNEIGELIKMQGGEIPQEQIARLVAFLLSDDSLFINGENIDIKGLL